MLHITRRERKINSFVRVFDTDPDVEAVVDKGGVGWMVVAGQRGEAPVEDRLVLDDVDGGLVGAAGAGREVRSQVAPVARSLRARVAEQFMDNLPKEEERSGNVRRLCPIYKQVISELEQLLR